MEMGDFVWQILLGYTLKKVVMFSSSIFPEPLRGDVVELGVNDEIFLRLVTWSISSLPIRRRYRSAMNPFFALSHD